MVKPGLQNRPEMVTLPKAQPLIKHLPKSDVPCFAQNKETIRTLRGLNLIKKSLL